MCVSAVGVFKGAINVKIYVHGNCQAPGLGNLLLESNAPIEQIRSRQIYDVQIERETKTILSDIRTADVIITQPVSDNYRGTNLLSTSNIVQQAKHDARIIVFPVIYHRGLLPQIFPMSDIHQGRLAYHDAHALDFFLRGRGADDFLEATLRSDFLCRDFVNLELLETTGELLRRERFHQVDVGVGDIIADKLRNSQPMWVVNHPSRPVLAAVANRILRQLGFDPDVDEKGEDGLNEFVCPPYLSTLLAAGHSGGDVRPDEACAGGVWESRRIFYHSVFDFYAHIGRERLNEALSHSPQIVAYLQRYRRWEHNPERRDPRKLVEALYSVFFGRASNTSEALHHLQTLEQLGFETLVSAFPQSPEFVASGGGTALHQRFAS